MLAITPSKEETLLKVIALNSACFSFIGSLIVWFFFHKSVGYFQFVTKFDWIPFLNLTFTLGVDGISLFFLLIESWSILFLYFFIFLNFMLLFLNIIYCKLILKI